VCQRRSILSIVYLGEGKAEEEGNYEDFADETTKNII
jgi:hypothetical protein